MSGVLDSPDEFESEIGLLPEVLLAEFSALGRIRAFPKNTVVVVEGEPAESFYLVLEGSLRVYTSDETGREVELSVLKPAQYFGEIMLGSPVRTASVKTLTAAKLRMIRRSELERLLADRPDIALHVIQTLAGRVLALTRQVRSLALKDVYGRVTGLLLERAQEIDGRHVSPPISQRKIAERVGASASMVNRVLKDLAEGGYVSVTREGIVLNRAFPKGW